MELCSCLTGDVALVLLADFWTLFLSPFLTVLLAEGTRQSWRLLDEFLCIFPSWYVAQYLVRLWMHILRQLADGFGRIGKFLYVVW